MRHLPPQPEASGIYDLLSPENWPEGVVWHYTNAAGLAGIIRDNVLWASSTAFMNDRHEMRTGANLIRSLLGRHESYLEPRVYSDVEQMVYYATSQDRNKTFVACACKDPNNLTMWRNYTGPEVGFAVGLDVSRALSMRRQIALTEATFDHLGLAAETRQDLLDHAHRDLGSFIWREAVYSHERQVQIAWGRLKELESVSLAKSGRHHAERPELDIMSNIWDELQTFKHYGFEDEREMRVVCWAGLHTDLVYLKHRPSPYGVVPYVELCIPEDPTSIPMNGPEAVRELPIVGIAVGPTPYPEEAATGVVELLRSAGRNSIDVIPSELPFRR